MTILTVFLVILLIVCALIVERTKDLLSAIIVFAAFSLVLSVLWLILQAPDVALTEAAVGAGITTVVMLAVLAKTERYER
jgi:energy-converting hydrogenase B subunit D